MFAKVVRRLDDRQPLPSRLAIRVAEFEPEADVTIRVVDGKSTTTEFRNS
jgi:hypothetical protein